MLTRLSIRWSLVLLPALVLSPGARAADTGTLTGSVDRPGEVTAVQAIDRESGKKYPGQVEARTGQFTITGLPVGATYDCILDAGPARLEGVCLRVPRSD